MGIDRLKLHRRVAWAAIAAALAGVYALKPQGEIAAAVMLCILPALVYALVLGVRIRRLAREAAGASPLSAERPVWMIAALAAPVVLFDVLVAGQGIWSWLLVVVALVYYAPKSLFALRNRPVMKLRLQKGALLLALGLAAAMFVRFDAQREERRADEVVQAVQRYKAAHGSYPAAMEALVPRFLPQLPGRGRVAFSPPLKYRSDASGGPTLTYYAFPPFGRRVFSFEAASWSEVD